MRVVKETVFNASSTGASVNSLAVDCTHMYVVKAVAVLTGTPTGDLILQGSLDNTTFYDIGSATSFSGSGGSAVFSETTAGWNYYRLKYTRSSGTGTITAVINGKGN